MTGFYEVEMSHDTVHSGTVYFINQSGRHLVGSTGDHLDKRDAISEAKQIAKRHLDGLEIIRLDLEDLH